MSAIGSALMLGQEALGRSDAVLVLCVIGGMLLWLTGRRLARVLCAITGLVLGAAITVSLPGVEAYRDTLPLFVITGCIVGFAASWSMFRAFMGLLMAVVLAVSVPLVNLAVNQQPLPPMGAVVPASVLAEAMPAETESDRSDDARASPGARERVLEQVRTQVDHWQTWWKEQDLTRQRMVLGLALLGAMVGLFLGTLAPRTAASFVSSAGGGMMMIFPGIHLLERLGLEQWAQLAAVNPRPWVALGLITLLGVVVQWMLWRPRADK